MTTADHILDRLFAVGARHVFLVPGGAAMHMNDAMVRRTDMQWTACHHEYAAVIAAEAYAKVTGTLGVAMVTAGPGSTNAVTGVASAWVNGTPLIVLAGQVKTADRKRGMLRQRGIQEIDSGAIVKPITKSQYVGGNRIEHAIHDAVTGRKGPVWVEMPLDLQSQEATTYQHVVRSHEKPTITINDVVDAAHRLYSAQRPLVFLGAGVRSAGAADLADLYVPTALTWEAADLLGDDDPWYVGRPGSLACRAANFAVQNADVILSIGARWDLATTGFAPDNFGKNAHRIVVDIDKAELAKLNVEQTIHADAKDFLMALKLVFHPHPNWTLWRERIRFWKKRYPIVSKQPELVTNLGLVDALSNILRPEDVIVQGSSGHQSEFFFMAFRTKRGQRIIADGSFGTMGYGIPAAIGAAVGSKRRTILIEGDGSLMPNMQELETIRRLNLPIKIVVVNNGGYASMRACQDRWFGRRIAADPASGMSFANIGRLAYAFGIKHVVVDEECSKSEQHLRELLDDDGPKIVEVMCPPDEERQPRLMSRTVNGKMESGGIEDLWPHLPNDELKVNMKR